MPQIFSGDGLKTLVRLGWDFFCYPFTRMFLSLDTLRLQLNAQLSLASCNSVSRSVFYRIRLLYTKVYPESSKLSDTGRLAYDEQIALWLYFALRVHLEVENYRLTELYMRRLEGKLAERGQRFTEAFSSFSAINSFFEQEQIYA